MDGTTRCDVNAAMSPIRTVGLRGVIMGTSVERVHPDGDNTTRVEQVNFREWEPINVNKQVLWYKAIADGRPACFHWTWIWPTKDKNRAHTAHTDARTRQGYHTWTAQYMSSYAEVRERGTLQQHAITLHTRHYDAVSRRAT